MEISVYKVRRKSDGYFLRRGPYYMVRQRDGSYHYRITWSKSFGRVYSRKSDITQTLNYLGFESIPDEWEIVEYKNE